MKYSFPVTSGLMTEALFTVTSDFQACLFTKEPIGCLQRVEFQACFFSVENCFRMDITLLVLFHSLLMRKELSPQNEAWCTP